MKDNILDYFRGNYTRFYQKYLPSIKKAGRKNEFKALCPFHSENNASFCFNNETGLFHCFGCSAGGDIFHFYAKVNALEIRADFKKILEGISNDFSIS